MNPPSPGDELDRLCQAAARLVSLLPHPPATLKIRHGTVSAEMTWEAAAPAGLAAPPATAPDERPDRGAAHPAPPDSPLGQIRAPLVGTFYRAAEPGAAPFVSVGDIVEAGQQIAIVESMKLMNPIEAETAGQVVEILVRDGAPVEYDQPLMVISPSGDTGCATLFPGASTPQEEALVGGGR